MKSIRSMYFPLLTENLILEDGISNSLGCSCNDPTFSTFLTSSNLFYFILTNRL